jgi:hypothetical protein
MSRSSGSMLLAMPLFALLVVSAPPPLPPALLAFSTPNCTTALMLWRVMKWLGFFRK